MDRCPECGAPGDPACEELFHELLALDHSREEPWGPLHGVAVSCYLLQHPASLPGGGYDVPLDVLRAFMTGGLAAASRLTERARRANSHRGHPRVQERPAARQAPGGFAVTIADVADGGTFPAAGYPERLHRWAEATLAAWQR